MGIKIKNKQFYQKLMKRNSESLYCSSHGLQSMNFVDEKQPEPKQVAEMQTVGSVSSKVYSTYLHSGGNCWVMLTLTILFAMAQALTSGCDYWITYGKGNACENHFFQRCLLVIIYFHS